MSLLIFAVLIVTTFDLISNVESQVDPCLDTVYKVIGGEDKRSSDYQLDLSADLAYSDDRLVEPPVWYRIMNDAGEDMPTSAPGTFKCGTWYPIWLNGQPPTVLDETVTRSVCLQSHTNECEREWDIRIKNCTGNFLVYELVKSPVIDSAYCFGHISPCPNGTSSETGFTPGCSNIFPSLSIIPVVEPQQGQGTVFIPSPLNVPNIEPVFKCKFDNPGSAYFYDIQWYINEISVKTDTNTVYGNTDTILRPRHWESSFDMNMLVKCAVRARHDNGTIPSPRIFSPNFVAGIVTDKHQYEVEEGSFVEIKIRATVPIGCNAMQFLHRCKETIKVSHPLVDSCQQTSATTGNVVIEEECGADIQANYWEAEHTLKVYGYIDNRYNSQSVRYATLSLTKTGSFTDASKAWDNLKIPDFNVFINDGDPKISGKYCYSSTDPNYYTFDGRYYSAQISGEYVLYRHKREPYWVHTLNSGCYWGSCNVGIAIRSHDSLFVVRTVDELYNPIQFVNSDDDFKSTFTSRTSPMIDMRQCDDKNLQVVRQGKEFTVTLPSGTEIFFRIKFDQSSHHNLLVVNNINIKPSLIDIGQTEGLCGSFNFDAADDFIDRNQFVNSWEIPHTSNESLFSESPQFTNDQFYKKPFCVCGEIASGSNPIGNYYNTVHCNLTQPREQCYNSETTSGTFFYTSCSGQHKRNTDDSDNIIDSTPLRYAEGFKEKYIPPDPEWRNGWTQDLARGACADGLNNLTALDICKEFAGLRIDEFINPCITDVRTTGGTTLLEGTIATMISSCITEVSRNETLMTTSSSNSSDTTSDTEPTVSLLDEIKSKLCINNCSNNGICDKTGICKCYSGFIGEQCSISKSSPPKKISIPGRGLCGTKSRSCAKTIINGVYESESIWCKLTLFRIINGETQIPDPSYIVEAEYHGFSSVSCPLGSSNRRKRSVTVPPVEGFQISLSYDGTNFGDEVSILIYDESCYSCNTTTETCILLDSCPLITSTESNDNTQQIGSTDLNIVTNPEPETVTTRTTLPPQTTSQQSTEEKTSSGEMIKVIGGVAGIIALLMVIGVIVYFKVTSKKRTTFIDGAANICNSPPVDNSMPYGTKQRELSHLSFSPEWLERKCPTPENLFLATECN